MPSLLMSTFYSPSCVLLLFLILLFNFSDGLANFTESDVATVDGEAGIGNGVVDGEVDIGHTFDINPQREEQRPTYFEVLKFGRQIHNLKTLFATQIVSLNWHHVETPYT